MAQYIPVEINPNTLGGLTSQVTMQNPSAIPIGFNQFVSAGGTKNLMLTSIDVFCTDGNLTQLAQPIVVNQIDMNGTVHTVQYSPMINGRSFNVQVKDLPLEEPFLFNGLSSFNYTILAGATLQLTIKAKKYDGKRKIFDTDLGHDEMILRHIMEPEEIKSKKKKGKSTKPIEGKEPDESEEEEGKDKMGEWEKEATVLLESLEPEETALASTNIPAPILIKHLAEVGEGPILEKFHKKTIFYYGIEPEEIDIDLKYKKHRENEPGFAPD